MSEDYLGGRVQPGMLQHDISPQAWPRALERVQIGVFVEALVHRACNPVADFSQGRVAWGTSKHPLQNLQHRKHSL